MINWMKWKDQEMKKKKWKDKEGLKLTESCCIDTSGVTVSVVSVNEVNNK